MNMFVLKDWYQVDFQTNSPATDLKKIDSAMSSLIKSGLMTRWFFLYEQPEGSLTIRVRMKSENRIKLKEGLKTSIEKQGLSFSESLPFSKYSESSKMLFNEEVAEKFANIMCEATQLALKKINNTLQFDNYRMVERLSHCIFNILAGLSLKSEEEFLKQRFLERARQVFNSDFENKIK